MVEFGTSSAFRGWVRVALTRALRARRARPPEVPEKGSMKEPQVHPYIGCTFGGIEVFRAARACAVISLC